MNLMYRLDKAATMLDVAEDAYSQNLASGIELAHVVEEVAAILKAIHSELVEVAEDLRAAKLKLEGNR